MNINNKKAKLEDIKNQPIIKWSGSKRVLAKEILNYFPKEFNNYYEPFLGGGSVFYHVLLKDLQENNVRNYYNSDYCLPLINLWNLIKNDANYLIEDYQEKWKNMINPKNCKNKEETENAIKNNKNYFNHVRQNFNKDLLEFLNSKITNVNKAKENACDFYFLLRTCINGLVRFNQKGLFNSSLHLTRIGINPKTLNNIIISWNKNIQQRKENINFNNINYKEILKTIKENDFVYLDPPYLGTKGMYYGKNTIDFKEFFEFLEELNKKKVKWILSFDGNNLEETKIPQHLYKKHLFLNNYYSTFNLTQNKTKRNVKESLYVSY